MAASRKFISIYISLVLLISVFFTFSLILVQTVDRKYDRKYSFFLEDSILSNLKNINESELSLSPLETNENQHEDSLDTKNHIKEPEQLPLTVIDYSETPSYIPLSYGYSKKDSNNFFFREITECESRNHLALTNNDTYQVNCSESPIEGIENSYLYQENLGPVSYTYDLIQLKNGQILNKSSEYHLVKCGNSAIDISIKNIKNEKEAKTMSDLSKNLSKQYNKKSFRPLTVIYYMIDSASRQLIYRNLPETFAYLNSFLPSDQSNFIMYDFKLNNAIRPFTFPNIIPMIYGVSFETFLEQKVKYRDDQQAFQNFIDDKSIIMQFKKRGFITLVSTDTVSGEIDRVLGTTLNSTHTVSNFYKIAHQYFGWNENLNDEACIGSHRPNYYSLKYVQDYIKNYKKLNKFAFIQTNIAHENTGTRLKATDKDFKEFFRGLFSSFDYANEDLVFMLLGDHGKSVGDYSTIESLSERAMASHFLISNKEFIKKFKLDETLLKNTKRLLSRYDWYKTLTLLSYMPYGVFQKDSKEYLNIDTDYDSINVLLEEAPVLRTCESIGVSQEFCLSYNLTSLTPAELQQDSVAVLLDSAKALINKQLLLKPLCNSIEFDKKIGFFKVIEGLANHFSRSYWIRVDLKGLNEVLLIQGIQLPSFYCSEKLNGLFRHLEVLPSGDYCMKLTGVTRLFPIISRSEISTHKTCSGILRLDNSLYLNDRKLSCSLFCEEMKMECKRPHLYHFVLDQIKRYYKGVELIGDMDSIEVVDGRIKAGRGGFCENIPENDAVCYCVYEGSDAWEGIYNDNIRENYK